ncbi:MAG: hypothetical protein IT430_05915 [Phycisphaerales bacterium]|nr:hypothetical protein [Phycisphaerales bacterium]
MMPRAFGLNRRCLAAAVLLGLATTVGISWAAMFWPRRGRDDYGPPASTFVGYTRTSDGYKIWTITRGRNAWHHVVTYSFLQISGHALMIPIADFEANKADVNALPRHLRPASIDDLHMQAWYRETGWPMPALTCSIHWVRQIRNADIIYGVEGGYQLPRDADFNPRALPLTPVWPGFAVNLGLWTACWLGSLWGFSALRRCSRRRRNCCTHCAYPRTGLPENSLCPECGR